MALSLNMRNVEDVVVVDVSGRLTIGEPVLLNAVRKLVESGMRKVILNLADVSYIDSCGLGQLVTIYTSAWNRKGKVSLLNPTERAMDLLRMTKLVTVFETFDDEGTAVRTLTGRAASTG